VAPKTPLRTVGAPLLLSTRGKKLDQDRRYKEPLRVAPSTGKCSKQPDRSAAAKTGRKHFFGARQFVTVRLRRQVLVSMVPCC